MGVVWGGKKFWLILLILIALIPLLDLFRPGLPMTHDGRDHVARIANFYQSLSEGNLVPRWAANLNWGYGHPILMFLYPLPSYIASFFHFLGFGLVDSTKIVFGLSFILSGIFMYFWVREFWGEEAGFISSLLYLFAPYRFVDLYVRGAIGENLVFVWPPLICWLALKLSKERRWLYFAGAALSLAAMILSHNALSLMFLPLIFGYMGYLGALGNSKKEIARLLFCYIAILFLGLTLSTFFWFPAFFEGKYTLRDIVTSGDYASRFRPFKDYLYSFWSYDGAPELSVQIGILHWLAVVLGFYCLWQFWGKKDRQWVLVGGLLVGFLATLFLLLKVSLPIWQTVSLIQKFQFPWRFLALMVFIPAVLAGSFVFLLDGKKKKIIFLLFGFFAFWFNKDYWHARDFSHQPESFYTDVFAGTTDTGESSPRWSVRFMERYSTAPMEEIKGGVEIKEISRSTARHEYMVRAETSARLVENTLYFPGWDILVDGEPTEIQFQDPTYRGLITFNILEGERQVIARFRETKLRLFADLISLGGMGILVVSGIMKVALKTPPRWPG